MIKLDHIERFYFLGIGGIGMSALARYFAAKSYEVAGYDRNRSEICVSLENASCQISYEDSLATLPMSFTSRKNTLVVYTPAIPTTNSASLNTLNSLCWVTSFNSPNSIPKRMSGLSFP